MITEITKEYVKSLLKDGKRSDGRSLRGLRNIKIIPGVAQNAEGSAKVIWGDTQVLVGVKLGIGEPFSDTPDEGVLMVNTELSPIASPAFELGPPREEAVEISRVVDRGVRESKALDFGKLCIRAGELVWMVFVDIDVLNHGGNLIDASALGAIAALLNARIPKLKDGEIVYGEFEKKLEVRALPVACTVVKIDDKLLVDPNLEEEAAMDARLTITTIEDKGEIKLCAMQKGGAGGFTVEELEKCIDLVKGATTKVRKLLLKIKNNE